MNEWPLVTTAQAGDHEAFSHLVERYQAYLSGLVVQYVGKDDVADAVQEVWLAVHRKLWQLEEGAKFRSWLKQVAYHQCVNFRKVRHRRRRSEAYLGHDGWILLTERVASNDLHVNELIERRETRRLVINQLDALPADYGQILRLRYLNNLTSREIVNLTGLPESTVKWRLHEAKRLLKARLVEQAKKGREST